MMSAKTWIVVAPLLLSRRGWPWYACRAWHCCCCRCRYRLPGPVISWRWTRSICGNNIPLILASLRSAEKYSRTCQPDRPCVQASIDLRRGQSETLNQLRAYVLDLYQHLARLVLSLVKGELWGWNYRTVHTVLVYTVYSYSLTLYLLKLASKKNFKCMDIIFRAFVFESSFELRNTLGSCNETPQSLETIIASQWDFAASFSWCC